MLHHIEAQVLCQKFVINSTIDLGLLFFEKFFAKQKKIGIVTIFGVLGEYILYIQVNKKNLG